MLTLFLNVYLLLTSFYSLEFTTVEGKKISMSAYKGKKILIVNIASSSMRVGQLHGLQQLQKEYGDSLVIIGFPSNSFGREKKSDDQISKFCRDNYAVSFLIAAKDQVAGTNAHSVFNWLAQSQENGRAKGIVGGDFQKFLINEKGELIGVFSGSIEPSDPQLINAITSSEK